MYLRTLFPIPFLSARFPHCWKDPRPYPAAARLVFVTVVALGAEGFCRKLSVLLDQ